MVTWLNHYNQGKYLPLNKRRSEDPCLVNDKANHPSSNVNVTYYGSARKEKLYEEHLYEDDGSNVVCIDKHLLLQERIKRENGLPSVTAHSPTKTFHKVSKESRDTQNEVYVETSSIYPYGCKQISRKQKIGLHDGEARRLSEIRYLRKRLSEGLVGSTSPTAFTLTTNGEHGCLGGDWGIGLGEGLAESKSLTTFILAVNGEYRYLGGGWGKGLGEGLAESKSLTAFTLTINSKDGYLGGDWGKGLGEGLAESKSLTAFTLTVNSKDGYLGGGWGKGLGEGLAESESLTAFTLTVNSKLRYLRGDWGKRLVEGLAKSKSLTAFTLTINSKHRYLCGDWGKRLGEGLAKSTSLTSFILKLNNIDGGYLRVNGEWLAHLRSSLRGRNFSLSDNGRIADSSILDDDFYLFHLDKGVREGPTVNPRGKVQTKSVYGVTGSFEKKKKACGKKTNRCTLM